MNDFIGPQQPQISGNAKLNEDLTREKLELEIEELRRRANNNNAMIKLELEIEDLRKKIADNKQNEKLALEIIGLKRSEWQKPSVVAPIAATFITLGLAQWLGIFDVKRDRNQVEAIKLQNDKFTLEQGNKELASEREKLKSTIEGFKTRISELEGQYAKTNNDLKAALNAEANAYIRLRDTLFGKFIKDMESCANKETEDVNEFSDIIGDPITRKRILTTNPFIPRATDEIAASYSNCVGASLNEFNHGIRLKPVDQKALEYKLIEAKPLLQKIIVEFESSFIETINQWIKRPDSFLPPTEHDRRNLRFLPSYDDADQRAKELWIAAIAKNRLLGLNLNFQESSKKAIDAVKNINW